MVEYEQAHPIDKARFHAGAAALVSLAWEYVVSLRLARIAESREVGYNTATGFLLGHNGRHFIGTAWHVYDEYVTRKEAGEDLVLLANDVPLEPAQVAWEDEANDVVFLFAPEKAVPSIGALAYEPGFRWPPRRVTTDDVVFFCGFPKCLRGDGHPSEIEFGNLSLMLTVTSVSEHHFVLQLNREQMIDAGRVAFPGPETPLGGISGSPVFAMDDLSYPLVGIVSQMGESLPLIYIRSLTDAPADMGLLPPAL